jgi:hypothetical protein
MTIRAASDLLDNDGAETHGFVADNVRAMTAEGSLLR